jgi:putative mRNA 3-end processing factor
MKKLPVRLSPKPSLMFEYQKGIHIYDTKLWLDSPRSRELCFISHAHLDHARRHKTIIATCATSLLSQHRVGKSKVIELDYDRWFSLDATRLKLLPAGHILGSSQILIEKDGQRLLYSGDFRLRSALTVEPFQTEHADILIMESTYGRPHYRFPSRQLVVNQLLQAVSSALSNDLQPVILAYALGKSQEMVRILTQAQFRVAVTRDIYQLCQLYNQLGMKLGRYALFDGHLAPGSVLVASPYHRKSRLLRSLSRKLLFYVSGWAIDSSAKHLFRVDEAFPISDHADYDELLEYITTVKPQIVYLTHGFPEFIHSLREKGIKAHPLVPPVQTELFQEL